MSIEWRDAMNVGDPSIDGDHQHLVELINDFETAIAGRIDHKGIARVLMGLVEYTADHFKREEEIMVEIRYPYLDSHRRSHRDVLKKLTEHVQDYVGADKSRRDDMIRSMAGFLREWLVDHIIHSDLRMKPYVLRFREEMSETEKRKRAAIAQSEAMAMAKAKASLL